MAIVSVYIEEGCITCDACEENLPEVFHVTDDTCFIKEVKITSGGDSNLSSKPMFDLTVG
ncbi:MAG: hypothetical protein VXA41_05535 [Euryarchaeota archaeon]